MAPSQLVTCEEVPTYEQAYKHKKFNCVYTHKKFGFRLAPRNAQMNKQQPQLTTLQINDAAKKHTSKQLRELFRPYALDVETPRSRKVQQSDSQPVPHSRWTTPIQQTPSPKIASKPAQAMVYNKHNYTLMLQKQIEALYIRQMLEQQGYDFGYNWRAVPIQHVGY